VLELLLSRRSYGPKSPVIAGSSQIYPSHRSSVVIAAARWSKGVGGEVSRGGPKALGEVDNAGIDVGDADGGGVE
jgi:hypothetical protein